MAALFELLNYMDRQEDRKLARQKAEVQMEAYRRTQNRIAEQEGKARAIADGLTKTFSDVESAQREFDSVQKQWFEARSKGMLSPEMNDMYRNAFSNASSNLELQKSKYRVLTMEKGHMDGSLNKSIAETAKPMLNNIFNPKKDPYDQIEEERKTQTEDTATGVRTEVTQRGPASAFAGQSAYEPMQDDTYTAPATATSLLGFTPSGFQSDPEAVTPEFSYKPVRDRGGITSEEDVDGATAVDPMATQPSANPFSSQNTNPIATAPQADQASVRKEAEAILKNPNIPPEKKQQVRERAAKLGVTL